MLHVIILRAQYLTNCSCHVKGPTDILICQYYFLILIFDRHICIRVYVLRYMLVLKVFIKARKNALTSNLK